MDVAEDDDPCSSNNTDANKRKRTDIGQSASYRATKRSRTRDTCAGRFTGRRKKDLCERPLEPFYQLLLSARLFLGRVLSPNPALCEISGSETGAVLRKLDQKFALRTTDRKGSPWHCSLCSIESNGGEDESPGAIVHRNTDRVASLSEFSSTCRFLLPCSRKPVVIDAPGVIVANPCGVHNACVGCIKRMALLGSGRNPMPCVSVIPAGCPSMGPIGCDLEWIGITEKQVTTTSRTTAGILCPSIGCESKGYMVLLDTPQGVVGCPSCKRKFCVACRSEKGACIPGCDRSSGIGTNPSKKKSVVLPPFWHKRDYWLSELGTFIDPSRVVWEQAREVLCGMDTFHPRCGGAGGCGILLEKSVACNAVPHCEGEHCWACGATGFPTLTASHWRTDKDDRKKMHPALGPCPRWDSDPLWIRVGVRCRENECYSAEYPCTTASHAAGLSARDHYRRVRHLIGMSSERDRSVHETTTEWLLWLLSRGTIGVSHFYPKNTGSSDTFYLKNANDHDKNNNKFEWPSHARRAILDAIDAVMGNESKGPLQLSEPENTLQIERDLDTSGAFFYGTRSITVPPSACFGLDVFSYNFVAEPGTCFDTKNSTTHSHPCRIDRTRYLPPAIVSLDHRERHARRTAALTKKSRRCVVTG